LERDLVGRVREDSRRDLKETEALDHAAHEDVSATVPHCAPPARRGELDPGEDAFEERRVLAAPERTAEWSFPSVKEHK
jgi:hypothetical protein